MVKNPQETLTGQHEKIGGVTLSKKIPDLLMEYSNKIRNYGWKVVITELELSEPSGSFGEDESYKGQLAVRFRKFGSGKQGEIIDEATELVRLQSINSSSRKQLDGDDPNDLFTDRYYYQFDQRELLTMADEASQRIRYQEAGGNPDDDAWAITPEQLRKHYPEYFNSKILIDGWAKSFDQSKAGTSEELSPDEVQRVERVASIINSTLIKAMHDDAQPVVVTAGNSAGVQKLIGPVLEEAGCQLLFALPESKTPAKYINPSKTLILQAPPQEGLASQWGDELVGETGIASAEFRVRTVILIGGGENLKKQLPIYLDNVLAAKQKNKMYIIAAVQGVGGVSSKDQLLAELEQYTQDEKYKSLFPRLLDKGYLPDWLVLLDSEDETQLASKVEELIMRTHWSDMF